MVLLCPNCLQVPIISSKSKRGALLLSEATHPLGFVFHPAAPTCSGSFSNNAFSCCLFTFLVIYIYAHCFYGGFCLCVYLFVCFFISTSLITALTHSFSSQLSFWRQPFCLHHLTSHLSPNLLTVWLLPSSLKMISASHQRPRLLNTFLAFIFLDLSAAFDPTDQALLKIFSQSFLKFYSYLLQPPMWTFLLSAP